MHVAQQLGNKDILNIRRFTTTKGLHSLIIISLISVPNRNIAFFFVFFFAPVEPEFDLM